MEGRPFVCNKNLLKVAEKKKFTTLIRDSGVSPGDQECFNATDLHSFLGCSQKRKRRLCGLNRCFKDRLASTEYEYDLDYQSP